MKYLSQSRQYYLLCFHWNHEIRLKIEGQKRKINNLAVVNVVRSDDWITLRIDVWALIEIWSDSFVSKNLCNEINFSKVVSVKETGNKGFIKIFSDVSKHAVLWWKWTAKLVLIRNLLIKLAFPCEILFGLHVTWERREVLQVFRSIKQGSSTFLWSISVNCLAYL